MSKQRPGGVGRRSFLAGIGAAGAATVATTVEHPEPAQAATTAPPPSLERAARIAATEQTPLTFSAAPDGLHVSNPGSDHMVQMLRDLKYDYVAATPGTTFRGLQESVINYAGNTKPEWITAIHEDISAAIAHGYAKITGKPMAIMVHNTVGLQHASMGIYNAWCDRVPILVFTGNYGDGALRITGADWDHSATDDAAMVRGYIKYDEMPESIEHFKESLLRAHGLITTPPMGPAMLVVDYTLQEYPAPTKPQAPMPGFVPAAMPVGDPAAVQQIAKMLVAAQYPVIVADRATRSQADVDNIVKLAELLQAPVIDKGGRMNFPTNHYLYGAPPMVSAADVVLALDVGDLWGTVNDLSDTIERVSVRRIRPDAKVLSIDSQLLVGAGNYQDKQRFYQADLPVPGDAAATLPYLIEAVNSALTPARRNQNEQRAARLKQAFLMRRAADVQDAAIAWNAEPISTARVCTELWEQIRHDDWALVGSSIQLSWPQRLWDFTKYHNWNGGSGGAGIGYTNPAAVGAALAYRNSGIMPVNINGDGDFMMGPGAMWTCAHHKLPLLTIIHNNRAWHQETMSVQILASRRNRHPENGRIGTVITDPNMNYAKFAEAQGIEGIGPITNPADVGPALARAVKIVKSGYPVIVDMVMQPR